MRIFLSHALTDKDLVNRLDHSLKAYGIKLLIAEHYVSMTGTITKKIEDMIDSCDAGLILLTQSGFNSFFVNQEIGYLKKAKKPMLKVVEKGYEDKITGFIYGHDYIPYDPAAPEDTIKKITNSLTSFYKKKQQERAMNQKLLIGFGIFAGALFLMSDGDE